MNSVRDISALLVLGFSIFQLISCGRDRGTEISSGGVDRGGELKVVAVSGAPRVMHAPTQGKIVGRGDTFRTGDTVIVPKGSGIVLKNELGDIMYAEQGTRFRVTESGDSGVRVELQQGEMDFDVERKLEGSRFVVTTPTTVVGVRGTRFTVKAEEVSPTSSQE